MHAMLLVTQREQLGLFISHRVLAFVHALQAFFLVVTRLLALWQYEVCRSWDLPMSNSQQRLSGEDY